MSISETEVVETAATAAEELVFSRLHPSDVTDFDVRVTFEDRELEVDIYLEVADSAEADAETVADDAALAARGAVDDLLE